MKTFKSLLETTDGPIGKGAQDFAVKAASWNKKPRPEYFIGSDEIMEPYDDKKKPTYLGKDNKGKVFDHGTKKDQTKLAGYHNGDDRKVYEEVEELDEVSKDTLGSYIKKSVDNATRTKFQAIAHTKKSFDAGGDTKDMHDMMADKLHRRYNNRVKGVSLAVDKLTNESFEGLEEAVATIPGNVALSLVDRHTSAAMYHKKNGNMKGYAAHINHATHIEDAVIRAGSDMPIRSKAIVDKSDKIWAAHPHKTTKNESVEELDEVSKQRLVDYMDKSKKDFKSLQKKYHADKITPDEENRMDRRLSGQNLAMNKFHGRAKIAASGKDRAYDIAQKALRKESVEDFEESHIKHNRPADSDEAADQKPMKIKLTDREFKHETVPMKSSNLKFMNKIAEELTRRALEEVTIKTNRADKKAVIVHAIDPETGQSKTYVRKAATGEVNVGKISEDKDPCWDNYKQVGMKKKNGKTVPNCIPEEVELEETFKSGPMSLLDKSSVSISSADAMTLNTLYGTLSDNNKAKMDEKLRKDKKGFSDILSFAKNAV